MTDAEIERLARIAADKLTAALLEDLIKPVSTLDPDTLRRLQNKTLELVANRLGHAAKKNSEITS
jgi:hypothetical protein